MNKHEQQVIDPKFFIKMTVNEMSMIQLAWAYAHLKEMKLMRIDNGEIGQWITHGGEYNSHTVWTSFTPHLDWKLIGDEMDKHDIVLKHSLLNKDPSTLHCAKPSQKLEYMAFGATKRIAVLRCLVYMLLVDMGSMFVPSEEFIASTDKDD